MYKYVLKRLLLIIPVVLFVLFVVYTIMALTPGDPGRMILGVKADQALVDQLNHELGVDQPFFTRFFNYIKGIVTEADFGVSWRTQEPVFDEIWVRFPYTLLLATVSIGIASIVGVVLGIISAVKQYSVLDNALTVTALMLSVIPGFWLGMILILIFSIHLGILPASGAKSFDSFILPVMVLALGAVGGLLRLTRSAMLETLREDYIRTARAKGASETRIIFHHALKNALMPVITNIGMTYGAMLGGAVITDTVFNSPGLGLYIVTAIRTKDIPVVMGCVILIAVAYSVVMLIVDIIYAYIDPRIKAKYVEG